MNRVTTFAIALVAGISAGSAANAQEATYCGRALLDHLNPAVPQRGACIQLQGVSVGGDPWFCNANQDNNVYNEINDLIQQAVLEQPSPKKCRITTRPRTDNLDTHNEIGSIECGTFSCP